MSGEIDRDTVLSRLHCHKTAFPTSFLKSTATICGVSDDLFPCPFLIALLLRLLVPVCCVALQGYRYELWCIARAAGLRFCTVSTA